jgi:hypothetical protein
VTTPPLRPADGSDPPIAHHYVFVLLAQAAVLLGLAWLAAHYR